MPSFGCAGAGAAAAGVEGPREQPVQITDRARAAIQLRIVCSLSFGSCERAPRVKTLGGGELRVNRDARVTKEYLAGAPGRLRAGTLTARTYAAELPATSRHNRSRPIV